MEHEGWCGEKVWLQWTLPSFIIFSTTIVSTAIERKRVFVEFAVHLIKPVLVAFSSLGYILNDKDHANLLGLEQES